MLSILIPVYNYDITDLVNTLIHQITSEHIDYEIIVMDDCSTNNDLVEINKAINDFENCSFIAQKINVGRTKTRLNLANKAKFEWLLFLDADVIPKKPNFIKIILKHLNKGIDMINGGIAYETHKPDRKFSLRWFYGHKVEAKSIGERRKNPYTTIVSGNFMIRKTLFSYIIEDIKENRYGLDIIFSYLLEKQNISILHVDNPVIHLGLEDNLSFIKKSLDSVETTLYLQETNRIPNDFRPLQKSYQFLKRIRSISLVYAVLSLFEKLLLKNLMSKHPNLFLFDLYRLHHFIKIQYNKSAPFTS